MPPAQKETARTGESLFSSQRAVIDRVIAFVCSRHHLSGPEAEDFGSHVRLKLIENDYAILRKFEGRSAIRTYITVVIERLFLDDRIRAWGKWRPSAEAKRAGAVAVLLEQLMMRDGYSFEQACEVMATNHRVAESRADLERIAARLPARAPRRMEGEDALAAVAAPERADDAVLDLERAERSARLAAALARAKERFEPQDRLILALRFEDGRTVAEIAAIIRADQKALYRRVERLLRDLRTALEAEGITGSEVRESFGDAAVSIEDDARGGKSMPRPSIARGAR